MIAITPSLYYLDQFIQPHIPLISFQGFLSEFVATHWALDSTLNWDDLKVSSSSQLSVLPCTLYCCFAAAFICACHAKMTILIVYLILSSGYGKSPDFQLL